MAKIAAIVGPEYEDSELDQPLEALKEAGHEVEILGLEAGQQLEGKQGNSKVKVDAAAKDRDPGSYDGLLIPGGHSPDKLRTDKDVVSFVKRFDQTKRPMAIICHGPQLLIEADLVRGRTLTSWPSVRTDLRNAGANVVDRQVVEDANWITSRSPDDLQAFSRAFLRRLDKAGSAAAE